MKRLVQIKTEPESKVSFSGIEKKILSINSDIAPCICQVFVCVYK